MDQQLLTQWQRLQVTPDHLHIYNVEEVHPFLYFIEQQRHLPPPPTPQLRVIPLPPLTKQVRFDPVAVDITTPTLPRTTTPGNLKSVRFSKEDSVVYIDDSVNSSRRYLRSRKEY
jgi:hypothetical protein